MSMLYHFPEMKSIKFGDALGLAMNRAGNESVISTLYSGDPDTEPSFKW